MAVPKFYQFFMPVIESLYSAERMKVSEIRAYCISAMALTPADVAQMLPSEKQPTVTIGFIGQCSI